MLKLTNDDKKSPADTKCDEDLEFGVCHLQLDAFEILATSS
jgi:hypothetical protein